MNELCKIIKNTVLPNFVNMETAIKTYDRNADCCGAPHGDMFITRCIRLTHGFLILAIPVMKNPIFMRTE